MVNGVVDALAAMESLLSSSQCRCPFH